METNAVNQLTLDGIERFGSKWRVTISLPVPKDVHSLFAEVKASFDIIELGHNIASKLASKLKDQRNILPEDSLEDINDLIENIESSLIYENVSALKDWNAVDLAELASDVQESLIGLLNELYDWAGYYRILISVR